MRRRAPRLYNKLLNGLYGPVVTQNTYVDSQIPLPKHRDTQNSGTSVTNELIDNKDSNQQISAKDGYKEKTPLSLSILPKRQRKRFFLPALDYLSVYAIAVNEENACGGRVVTAPTNGAAGTIPAVLKYYLEFISDNPENDIMEFLLTTAAVAMLFKRGASISGKISLLHLVG